LKLVQRGAGATLKVGVNLKAGLNYYIFIKLALKKKPMAITTPIEPDRTYHIYNRGVNKTKLFKQTEHYNRFIKNMFKYLPSICTIHAWCLLGNHFHFLIQTKSVQELIKQRFIKSGLDHDEIIKVNYNQFSKLFNAYAKYFNLKVHRDGSLFDSRFKKVPVRSEEQFRNLILYIHNNPAHHNICKNPANYKWSSLKYYLNNAKRLPFMTENINEFGGLDAFIEAHQLHQQKMDFKKEFLE